MFVQPNIFNVSVTALAVVDPSSLVIVANKFCVEPVAGASSNVKFPAPSVVRTCVALPSDIPKSVKLVGIAVASAASVMPYPASVVGVAVKSVNAPLNTLPATGCTH